MMKGIYVFELLSFFTCINFCVGETTFIVPDDFNNIQSAINAAHSGDTILIRPGLYNENIKFKDGINLRGQSTDSNIVTIQCGSLEHVVEVRNCRSGKISNLSFRHFPIYDSNKHVDILSVKQSNIEISDCNISGAKGCGICVGDNSRSIIRNCVITKNSFFGINIYGLKTYANLTSNIITDNKRSGIVVYDGAACEARDNRCISNENGISVWDANEKSIILQNTCLKNSYYGIDVQTSCDSCVVKNFCSQNQFEGIYIIKCKTLIATQNECKANGRNGISVLNTTGCDIDMNKCYGNGHDGIRAIENSVDVNIVNNTCSANKTVGILLWKSIGAISKNISTDNNEIGIYVAECPNNVKVMNNTCLANNNGFKIWKSKIVSVANNIAKSNKECGIYLDESIGSVTVSDNICQDNDQDGIYITASNSIAAQNNACRMNKWRGICVYKCSSISLIGNRSFGNFNSGIEYQAASGTAGNNICRFNHTNGIMASEHNTDVMLTDNTCSDNYPSGIFFKKGSSGKAVGNVCTNNAFSGIAASGAGTNPVIGENNFSGNGKWRIRFWGEAQPKIESGSVQKDDTGKASKKE